jgi:class 3 adenylate cyclase/predicted ATPase
MSIEVAEWLRGLGLDQYTTAFRDNDIDGDVLADLTSDDLLGMGVTSIGHRRRLLAALAKLNDSTIAESAPPRAVVEYAERRQLTVMFCDLVGSTALAAQLDPEDLRAVVGEYHRALTATVAPFAGFVAKYMGDGALIYFGYPEAHEDDAERAVRAGLALIDAIGRLDIPERLQARIGIATGLAVVGDLIGEGAAQERGVIGETPNLAARLQALAQPDSLVIADGTRRQIGGLFDTEDLGLRSLAGFGEPQRAWRVIGESAEVSRFAALRSGTTPLVGRGEELDLLLRRWQQAKTDGGRVVLASGEPGIGKSRLAAALYDSIEREPHTRLRYFCSPHHQDSPLHPFIVQLERAAGFSRDDAPERKLARLQALFDPGLRDRDELVLIAELLSLPNAAEDLNLSPQRKREKLFEALLHQLEVMASAQPVLMVFEDAHWIDPTSRELVDLAIDRVSRIPVLLVVTFRPEFQHAWGGQPHVAMLTLNRLDRRDGVALVQSLVGNLALDPDIVTDIVERTDGVPLFVEELTKAVLETAGQENRVAAVLAASPAAGLAIPATLHASLMARLDRLGVIAKEIAQIGAVLGREFGYQLIERVAQRPEAELRGGLERLCESGLLFCRGAPPHSSYLFKHALVQDAAYGTLLRGRRHELHARVAETLERHFADLAERQPELLAHHLTAAGATANAVDQWLKAGRYAAARSAHLEALGHIERGLGLLGSLPPGPARDAQEIELQLGLGLSSLTARGFASPEAANAYARASELAEMRRDARQLFQGLYGLWQNHTAAGRIPPARALSQRLLRVADGEGDPGLRLQAHHSAWTTGFFGGEPSAAHEHAEAGHRLYDLEAHRSHRFIYGGHDPGVCAHVVRAQAGWMLGYPDRALARESDSLALVETIAHPFSLGVTLLFAAMLHVHRREPQLVLQFLDRAELLAAEQHFKVVYEPRILRGAALAEHGATDEAIAVLREGLAAMERVGALLLRSHGLATLAGLLLRRGDRTAALAAVREGMATADDTGQHWWDAELHRQNGLVTLAANKRDEAQACFGEALRVAREQQAKSLELRAATSLAQLWGEEGRRAEARELLAPLFGWFTEGFETADLKEARTLLTSLG